MNRSDTPCGLAGAAFACDRAADAATDRTRIDFDVRGKPLRPKEALEAMVSVHRQPRSSALYERVTGRISLQRCSDPAFARLRSTLKAWFAVPDQ